MDDDDKTHYAFVKCARCTPNCSITVDPSLVTCIDCLKEIGLVWYDAMKKQRDKRV